MLLYKGQLKTSKYDVKRVYNHHDKEYYNEDQDILTYDIETTSAWIDKQGNITEYKAGYSNEYWNCLIPVAIPYIWQFSFNNTVYYGREFRDFLNVLNDLPKQNKYIIWVHNLAFEFQFLLNMLTPETVSARASHKPMYAIFKEFPNIEFRCTYYLTNLSLASVGKMLKMPKMVGDLDYEKIRTPYTKLTEKELNYCKRDCEVVYKLIEKKKAQYGTLSKIPYTATGEVRRELKHILYKYVDNYNNKIKRLIPHSASEYDMLKTVYAGGYTHANALYKGQVIHGVITHWDFTSSYPYCLLLPIYPSSPWILQYQAHEPSEEEIKKYAYIMLVELTNIKCNTINTYIQSSKIDIRESKNVLNDNGRVRQADKIRIYITEYDLLIIKKMYKFDKMEILEQYKSTKSYLPKPFIEYILKLYGNKTSLKDVEGMEDIYNSDKQKVNCLYGMCVTAPVFADVTIDKNYKWGMSQLDSMTIEEEFNKMRKDWKDKKYFLNYSWGIWCSNYAKYNLFKCILKDEEHVIYCDTDSIFFYGDTDFNEYNKEVEENLKEMCRVNNIDYELCQPKTKDGDKKLIGIFDKEKTIKEFVTLGAKRYCYRLAKDDTLHITVSGINKEAVSCLNNDIYNFTENFNFDKDTDGVKKQLCTYIYDQPEIKFSDGYISTYKYGVNLRRTGYKMTITDDYTNLCDLMQEFIDGRIWANIPDKFLVSLRGCFVKVDKNKIKE